MTCDHKFIDTNYCAKCGASVDTIRTRSSYPDDVVAVMRDTISAQRDTIDAKNATIADLREEVTEQRRKIERLRNHLAACPSCATLGGRS